MASIAHKRSIMTLYSGSADMESHQTRIVLAEKGIFVDIIEVDRREDIDDLYDLNPYNSVPTLVDRDLILYNSQIIMEYLDERFPHPPLLPVYPVARARSRLMMYRIDRDWCSLVKKIQENEGEIADQARKELKDGLMAVLPLFGDFPYFMSEEFSLIDCYLAPILWRLPSLGIELPKQAQPILNYAERVFERESFQVSLTEAEQELRMDL